MTISNKVFKIGLFLCILIIGVGCDQTTKEIARDQLAYQAPVSYYKGLFILTYYENTGAFLGMGEHLSPMIKMMVLILLPFLMLLGITFHILKSNYSTLYFWGFCLVVAGGIGNLIDRWNDGFVVDFMHIKLIGAVKTGVFNFADVYVLLGMLLLFFHIWREES